jgi:hypothetical protein
MGGMMGGLLQMLGGGGGGGIGSMTVDGRVLQA